LSRLEAPQRLPPPPHRFWFYLSPSRAGAHDSTLDTSGLFPPRVSPSRPFFFSGLFGGPVDFPDLIVASRVASSIPCFVSISTPSSRGCLHPLNPTNLHSLYFFRRDTFPSLCAPGLRRVQSRRRAVFSRISSARRHAPRCLELDGPPPPLAHSFTPVGCRRPFVPSVGLSLPLSFLVIPRVCEQLFDKTALSLWWPAFFFFVAIVAPSLLGTPGSQFLPPNPVLRNSGYYLVLEVLLYPSVRSS